jgi:hypothetical protein
MSKLIVDTCVLIDSFQKDNLHRASSIAFIDHCVRHNQLITIPAHGWFEFWCNVNRLSAIERQYLHPMFADKMQLPVELIHIDEHFISRYGNVKIPYLKASDYIFLVVAYENKYQLVTRDAQMIKIGRQVGVQVFTPTEYLSQYTP